MPVPDFRSLMLPVLKALSDGSDVQVAEVCTRAAAEGLTPNDLLERTRGGHTTKLKDRVSWSITNFLYAGLVERVRRTVYRITPDGKQLLSRDPTRIDLKLLLQYPAYVEWKNRTHGKSPRSERPEQQDSESGETPEETWTVPRGSCAPSLKPRCWLGSAMPNRRFLNGRLSIC